MSESPPQPPDFSSLYEATIGPLRRYLGRLLGNPSEAQEIAHDAYIRIYEHPAQNPEALLYTTARRLAINCLKRRSISPVAPTDFGLDHTATPSPSVPQQVMARQEWQFLQSAIDDLPPGCREVLLLRKVELLSHREIADRLGIAISTVEKQHARALRLLRASLPSEIQAQLS